MPKRLYILGRAQVRKGRPQTTLLPAPLHYGVRDSSAYFLADCMVQQKIAGVSPRLAERSDSSTRRGVLWFLSESAEPSSL